MVIPVLGGEGKAAAAFEETEWSWAADDGDVDDDEGVEAADDEDAHPAASMESTVVGLQERAATSTALPLFLLFFFLSLAGIS